MIGIEIAYKSSDSKMTTSTSRIATVAVKPMYYITLYVRQIQLFQHLHHNQKQYNLSHSAYAGTKLNFHSIIIMHAF